MDLNNTPASTLQELYQLMLVDHPSTLDQHGQWSTDLPTFGGAYPTMDEGDGAASDARLWSWDEWHLIVGRCADDLEIVTRAPCPDERFEGLAGLNVRHYADIALLAAAIDEGSAADRTAHRDLLAGMQYLRLDGSESGWPAILEAWKADR